MNKSAIATYQGKMCLCKALRNGFLHRIIEDQLIEIYWLKPNETISWETISDMLLFAIIDNTVSCKGCDVEEDINFTMLDI